MKSEEDIINRLIYDVNNTLTAYERTIRNYSVKYTTNYMISGVENKFLRIILIDDTSNEDYKINFLYIYLTSKNNEKLILYKSSKLVDKLIESIKKSENYYDSQN